jgi:hypothetical protein
MEKEFEEFWKAKPKRDGDNPKQPALKSFRRVVKNGADPAAIIAATHEWRRELERKQKTGTQFVPMAVTWLNQQRFETEAPELKKQFYPAYPGSPEFEAWKRHHAGNKLMTSLLRQREQEGRAWQFETQWPPGLQAAE